MNRHVTIHEIAAVLHCSTKTVRRRVESGIIPAVQPGGKGTHLRFDLDAVLRAVHGASAGNHENPEPNEAANPKPLSGPRPKWAERKQNIERKNF